MARGNPYHVQSGEFGGQFTTGLRKGAGLPVNNEKFFPRDSTKATNATFIARFAMNKKLRGEKYINPAPDLIDVQGTEEAFAIAMKNSAVQLDKPTTMYKGVSSKFYRSLKLGDEFIDKGYSFVTTNQFMAKKYSSRTGGVIEILLPKGQKGVWGMADQNEFILPTNMKFKVIGVKNGTLQVKVA